MQWFPPVLREMGTSRSAGRRHDSGAVVLHMYLNVVKLQYSLKYEYYYGTTACIWVTGSTLCLRVVSSCRAEQVSAVTVLHACKFREFI